MNRRSAGDRLRRVAPVLLAAHLALVACESSAGGTPVASAGSPSSAAPAVTSAAPSPSPAPVKPRISKAGLAYFFTVAFGAEYRDKVKVIKMWAKPEVGIRVHGGSAKSRSCLNKVISDFNSLTATTDLKLTKGAADIELHFAPVAKFRSLEPWYISGNDGYVAARWADGYTITSANVLIRSSGISERIRCHLIREELTQGMGMLRDSDKYPESIFYGQYWSAPTRYSALDKEVIRLLYSGAVGPGDDKARVKKAVTVR